MWKGRFQSDRRRRVAACALASAVSGALACGSSTDWQGTIEVRDGVEYVKNPASGMLAAEDVPARIEFELERVFGADLAPSNAILASIGAIDVDREGNVYVIDDGNDRLVSFDAGGNVRWASGREGQGPGELQSPSGIAWDGDSLLYVCNNRCGRLDIWSTDGEFIDSHAMSAHGTQLGSVVGFVGTDALVISSSADGVASSRVSVLDMREGVELVAQWTVHVSDPQDRWYSVRPPVRTVGEEIVFGDIDSYEVRFFDRNGKLRRVVSRDVDYLVGVGAAELGEQNVFGLFSQLSPMIRLQSGELIAYAYWTETDDPHQLMARLFSDEGAETTSHGSIDVFDADGRFLFARSWTGTETPDVGRPRLVAPDGSLYTALEDPFPQVRRYRVTVR